MAERPEDLNLPNAVIAKIIKEALPDNVIISKDARLAISKAASVFVLYSTSCANNFAMQQKRKTINAQDVFDAMKELDFESFIAPLKANLEVYKNNQKDKKVQLDKKKKDVTTTSPTSSSSKDSEFTMHHDEVMVAEEEVEDEEDYGEQEIVEDTES
ncbi:hypothetical protein HELRODRAFT_75183 [Helobdella robusta]|uniref:DNA polymerase epsilon subunit 3 n=1 Tax=Helobdella robusta TaxID=6412 RepID=T1G223_HELRO|nr:hypothetical protein HELRODRAFT_75183 [Helobdella robusta]ESO08155.1 hypothetical protein HELRODRAFT_75183 [Helobdella robusta]